MTTATPRRAITSRRVDRSGAAALGAQYETSPTGEEVEWQLRGACTQKDPELFYPEGHGLEIHRKNRAAVSVCQDCSVWMQCRSWALEHRERWGVWGGLTEKQRKRILREDLENDEASPLGLAQPGAVDGLCGLA